MNKPIVKNSILLGIPTIISVLGIIMGLDILSNYINIIIIATILLLIIFIIFLIYYSKQEKTISDEIEKLKSTLASINKILGINSKIIVSIIGLLEGWNRNINKIAVDISTKGSANKNDWDYEKICTDICICCKDAISKFTGIEDDNDISVSLIKYYKNDSKEYVKMISHSSPQTSRPDVFDKEELLDDCNYQYAKMIRMNSRDIWAFENNDRIKQNFSARSRETDLTKYSQYIAIPVICSRNKYLGVLQITSKYNYKIMETETELIKFSQTFITPFVELFVLIEKIEKGMFAKPISQENGGKNQ